MNNEYADDMLRARYFLNTHSEDTKLVIFLTSLAKSEKTHSEKWSDVYDFIMINYPNYNNIITGLVYLIENKDIWEYI